MAPDSDRAGVVDRDLRLHLEQAGKINLEEAAAVGNGGHPCLADRTEIESAKGMPDQTVDRTFEGNNAGGGNGGHIHLEGSPHQLGDVDNNTVGYARVLLLHVDHLLEERPAGSAFDSHRYPLAVEVAPSLDRAGDGTDPGSDLQEARNVELNYLVSCDAGHPSLCCRGKIKGSDRWPDDVIDSPFEDHRSSAGDIHLDYAFLHPGYIDLPPVTRSRRG